MKYAAKSIYPFKSSPQAFTSTMIIPTLELLQMASYRVLAVEMGFWRSSAHIRSLRFSHINSAGDDFYLKHTSNGLKLSTSHAYYYKIQGQLSICDRLYCDFVCWTPKGIHIDRIFRQQHFFSQMKPKLDAFFVHVVLPCVLRGEMDKENTRPSSQEYCYCRKGEKGKIVACDNKSCAYEWFHFLCVGLESEPQGAWFCPGCQMQRH